MELRSNLDRDQNENIEEPSLQMKYNSLLLEIEALRIELLSATTLLDQREVKHAEEVTELRSRILGRKYGIESSVEDSPVANNREQG